MLDYPDQIKTINCHVEKTIMIIGNKWSLMILREFHLKKNETLRFNQMLKALHPISSKTLSAKLKELVKSEVIKKEVIPTTPVQINYSLSEKGLDLENVITSMAKWSVKWHAK